MVPLKYTAAVRDVLQHLERTQLGNIEKASDFIIHALAHKGTIHCHGIGHGIEGDFINRAGGLAAVQPFTFTFSVNDPVPDCLRDRPAPESVDKELEAIRLVVRTSHLRAGDVMMIGSVSGRNRGPVELALACRDAGIAVIGLTSMNYTSRVTAMHPSGKKLFEAVDVALDIGVPYGDAGIDIPGIPEKMLPLSGVAMDVVGWMLWGRVMERMAEQGTCPSVYISINRPDGKEWYDRQRADYNRRGF